MLVRAAALSTASEPGATANAVEKHEALGVEQRFLKTLSVGSGKPKRHAGAT